MEAAKIEVKEHGMKLQDFIELAIFVFGLKASASPRNAKRSRRRTSGESRDPLQTIHLADVRRFSRTSGARKRG